MRSVTVDPINKSAVCEGGCLWVDVDEAAAVHNLAAVGGTINHTGIGGLTLGGGYGHLTPKHGLVIDNLLAVEMVLADGSIVVCSKDQNPDLFWAVRGAGISFGVATKFTYRLHEQKNRVWGGMLVFPKEKLGPIVEFANTVVDPKVQNALLLLGFGAPPPAFAPAIMLPMFYNGTEKEAKEFYAPLFELGPLVDMTAEMDYVKINAMMNEAMQHGFRRSMKGAVFMAPLNLEYAEEIFSDFEEFMKETPGAKHTLVVFEFIPYGKVLEVGQQDTAFANRGAYGNLLFGPGWESQEDDDRCRQWTRRMAAKAKKELERRLEEGTDEVTKAGVGAYSNYDGAEHEAGKLVYGVNYDRLVELKKRYDAENVFSKGPKLVS
ncbi:6-hydroxy-D-nicotine oxidase protein [Rutstroemia sp. NJR-2017a BBW]|nr:6-hydroxy-D-nicotine oxidase protein [Rutstroemia sp. NJR-2017a BBW]